MKIIQYLQYFAVALTLFHSEILIGQLSYGGKPVENHLFPVQEIKMERMPWIDLTSKAKSAREAPIRLKSLEFAHTFPVQFTPFNSGEWRMLSDGRKIWKMGIQSKDAYSLNLIFDQFILAEGVSMFIYTPDRSKIIGSFNHRNNSEHGLAFEPLPGETVIIELLVPQAIQNFGELSIVSVNHDYLGIFGNKATMNGNSEKCNIDINCPEGNDHQLEKNAIMRLVINGSLLCTGALINNTSQDGKPYLLTANHCVNNQTKASNTVFLFGYEASSCNGTGTSNKSISGSTLRATKGSIDMTLLELSSTPDISYRPYYLGWNRQTTPATTTYGIHHPNGDWKKICKATDPPVSVTVEGYSLQSHWWIRKWVLGVTEPGSSGSPLLDVNSRIIGYLSGGAAECGHPFDDYYGKFSSAWDLFSPANEQLKVWLDPGNTGQTNLDGLNPHQNQSLAADFEIHTTYVCQDEAFVFTDFSRGNIISYDWDFGAGSIPSIATGKGPHLVQYASSGTKNINLEVGDGTNTHNLQRIIEVVIKTTTLPVADFTENIDQRQVTFINTSQNSLSNYWEFGDGTISTSVNPIKTYSSDGDYPVKLWIRNGPCSDKIIRILIIKERVYTELFRIFPNPSSGNFIVEFDISNANGYLEIFSLSGSLVYSENINQAIHSLNLEHLPVGVYLVKINYNDVIKNGKIFIRR